MKQKFRKIVLVFMVLSVSFSCKKGIYEENVMNEEVEQGVIVDKVSMVASQEIEGKKFVKNADINMEVGDAYKSTILIENKLKEVGGFVEASSLKSIILSENIFAISEEKSMLVCKYYSENRMKVRVPAEKMGDFLQYVSDEKVFLNYRNVSADDVTLNMELAKLEQKRLDKNQQSLGNLKPIKDIVEAINNNEYSRNQQKISSLKLEDEVKYSIIDIYIKEPKERILELEIANVNSIEAKYKHHFWCDIQEGLATGWYLLQRVVVLFSYLWPVLLMFIVGVGVWKNRGKIARKLGYQKKDK